MTLMTSRVILSKHFNDLLQIVFHLELKILLMVFLWFYLVDQKLDSVVYKTNSLLQAIFGRCCCYFDCLHNFYFFAISSNLFYIYPIFCISNGRTQTQTCSSNSNTLFLALKYQTLNFKHSSTHHY